MKSDDLLSYVNELRLIVLMENEDRTGFSQVLLNEQQFKKVSDAIIKKSTKDPSLKVGYEMATFDYKDDVVIPIQYFEGMESIWRE